MHEPARRRYLPSIDPAAIKPEAPPLPVFHAEVVARGPRTPVAPPFHGDALGPFGNSDAVQGAAPAELDRRAVRNLRDDIDRLGLLEQAQGTARRFARLADRLPPGFGGLGLLRQHDDGSGFRDMRVVRLE